MSNASVLYVGNDTVIEIRDLINTITGNYENGATVDVTIYRNGSPVSGQSWPLTLDYVAGSNGRYRAIIANTLSVTEGERLLAVVDVESASGTARFDEPIIIATRID